MNATAQTLLAPTLAIGEFSIRQHGNLYSLNDLHRAAGGEDRHRPKFFLMLSQVKELAAEIGKGGILPFSVKQGRNGGTYACRELVIAYAAWISAAFHLKVIRVFLAASTPATAPDSAARILNSTIGTDGFHVLGALVAGKVRALPTHARRRATMKLWAQVHAAFNVRSAEDIPADQLDSARQFIGSYALEGELLDAIPPKEEPRMNPPTFPRALPSGTPGAERTIKQANAVLSALQAWGIKELPRHVRPAFCDALMEIDSLMITGWTHVDEAMSHISTGMYLLKRWNKGGGLGIQKVHFVV